MGGGEAAEGWCKGRKRSRIKGRKGKGSGWKSQGEEVGKKMEKNNGRKWQESKGNVWGWRGGNSVKG